MLCNFLICPLIQFVHNTKRNQPSFHGMLKPPEKYMNAALTRGSLTPCKPTAFYEFVLQCFKQIEQTQNKFKQK